MSSERSLEPHVELAHVQPLLDRLVEQTVFTPIRQGSAVAETVARIGQAIAVGLLRPGDQLPTETRLAEALGISPVTLRGALAILREGGLLETRRGRGGGTFVSARRAAKRGLLRDAVIPPESDLQTFITYRAILEGGAAALVASGPNPELVEQLVGLIATMDMVDEFDAWSEADTVFHLAIADATGVQRLVSEIADVRLQSKRISLAYHPVPLSTMRLSNQQHREIVGAIGAQEPDSAREAMARHIEATLALWVGLGPVERLTALTSGRGVG
jgi:DNA-binding FadR family transcriptional regulator